MPAVYVGTRHGPGIATRAVCSLSPRSESGVRSAEDQTALQTQMSTVLLDEALRAMPMASPAAGDAVADT